MEKVVCTHCGSDNSIKAKYCSSCGYELPKAETDNRETEIQQKTNPKRNYKKQILGAIIGALVFWGSYYLVQNFFFNSNTFDKGMMHMASEINKSCPIMIDSETRLDNAIALPNKVLQYNYTLVNMLKDSVNTDEMKSILEPVIINFVKTNPDMKPLRDINTTVNYYYKDKTGVYLFTVSVEPKLYQ